VNQITFTDPDGTTWDVNVEQHSLNSWTIKRKQSGDEVCSCGFDSVQHFVTEFAMDTPEGLSRTFRGPFRYDFSSEEWYGERENEPITEPHRLTLLEQIKLLCLSEEHRLAKRESDDEP
jgi:hypothetical protein